MHIFTSIDCKFWSKIIPSLSPSVAHARVKAFWQKYSQNWICLFQPAKEWTPEKEISCQWERSDFISGVTDITSTAPVTHSHHSAWHLWEPLVVNFSEEDLFGAPRSTRCTKVTSLSGLKVKSYHSGKNVLTSPPPSELLQVTINPTVTQYYPQEEVSCPTSVLVICVFQNSEKPLPFHNLHTLLDTTAIKLFLSLVAFLVYRGVCRV